MTIQIRVSALPVQTAFIGLGFHDYAPQFAVSDRQMSEVFAKRWRELDPAFVRLTHAWKNWDWDRQLAWARFLRDDTRTSIYLTTWDPPVVAGAEALASYGGRVADLLQRFLDSGMDNLRWYGLANELSLGGWGTLREDLPVFREYHTAIRKALHERGLRVGMLATDASPVENWWTNGWAQTHMDGEVDAYGGHHYFNQHRPEHPDTFHWFRDQVAAQVALARGKPFIIGEYGPAQWQGERFGIQNWDGCAWFDTADEPLAALQAAEGMLAAVAGGAAAVAYWTFADFPDPIERRYANKWGTFRNSGTDNSPRPVYSALGQLIRAFRGPGEVHALHSGDDTVQGAALHRADGSWSVGVVSRAAETVDIRVELPGLQCGEDMRLARYRADSSTLSPIGDLPPAEAILRAGDDHVTAELPPRSLTMLNTRIDSEAPRAPTGLVFASSAGGAELRWRANSESDLCYYRIFRGIGQELEQIGSTIATSFFTEEGRSFAVQAVDRSGNAGPLSATVNVFSG